MIHFTRTITKEMILQALELDYSYYPKEYWLTNDQCFSYFQKNKNIYTMLLDENKVIGYMNFTPITKSLYDRIASGAFIDVNISASDIRSYKRSSTYYAYLSSIVISQPYRNQGYANMFLQALSDQIIEWAKKDEIFFTKIIADVISEGGVSLAEKFGMKRMKHTLNNSVLYEATLCPFGMKITQITEPIALVYKQLEGKNDKKQV